MVGHMAEVGALGKKRGVKRVMTDAWKAGLAKRTANYYSKKELKNETMD
jgi:hypothetical protein